MNARRPSRLLALTVLLLMSATWLHAADQPASAPAAEKLRESMLLPGVSLAEGVSEITGVAISPLLGVSAMGAWTYYKTEPALRHRLPWYCHPGVWGTGLSLILVCFLKDFLGAAAPALVKKPLDFAELFENKISALVASVGFVPLVALAMAQIDKLQPQAVVPSTGGHLAVVPVASIIDFGVHTPWLSIPVAIVAFGVVWLSSHAINVLIALSPFGIVDAGLKLAKLGLITLVAGSTMIHPYAGALVSLVLIVIALLLAGWSFRLTLFGTLMGADFLLNKRASEDDLKDGVKGFLARRVDGVPVRTLVKLKHDAAGLPTIGFHPWLMLPERHITLPPADMVVYKGLLHPTVAHRAPDGNSGAQHSLILLPRYRRLEETIARSYGCQEVMDSTLLRGLKAMRQWLVNMLSTGRNLIEARGSASE
ncbi:hypothetical protein [Prosthecobacter sp.]|uniref:hypothetical protein n=1 Tax=Prosthecobacter sp. TaxID=1965333 RepID=UPI001DD8B46A|nr:hypothetical protein [Prosthecobacter sp.]MCB1277718.1 hypothetical protein [Prosthecobacter sp.]